MKHCLDNLSKSLGETAQKMKFSIMDFFSKCYQIRNFLRMWLHLLKKSLMEKFIFCVMWANFLVNKTIPIGDLNLT